FDVDLEVTEPMGMETLVYFALNGAEVCGRVNPAANVQAGSRVQLLADLDRMHLIDDSTGQVL
ncbi:MAG TPA: sugar ABC transporter ATP-binding protein, partial [Alphaproteobacteria bacterium]|nr:sugar ABC transporter ATP-binding protein [Alphaproteobacteria bacterium]